MAMVIFFIQQGAENIVSYKVQSDNVFYAFTDTTVLKGQPVNPSEMLEVIPHSADTVKLYGSTRLKADAQSLFNTKFPEFFNWVDYAVGYLKKGDFEIVIGVQNEIVSLKNQLEEATLSLSSDSLLPPKTYINNFEIMTFEYDKGWTEIFPFLSRDLNFYTEYNNYVFLTHSRAGMQWLLKELQLGKTFDRKTVRERLTSQMNILNLSLLNNAFKYQIETRIGKGTKIHFGANKINLTDKSSRQLEMLEFEYLRSVNQVDVISLDSTENLVLITGPDGIMVSDLEGKEQWSKSIGTTESVSPILRDVNHDNTPEISFFCRSRIACFVSEW